MHLSHKTLNLSPLHHYQIGSIFLFVFGFFLFFPFYIFVFDFKLDLEIWQWYFFFPWMLFYVLYCLWMRSKVPDNEQRNSLKRPIGHWVLLGLTVLAMQFQPSELKTLETVDYAFIIFSIFLADGYWDFKRLPRIFLHR